jgi:hypothetical protein
MKRKIGTVLDDNVLIESKRRAAQEGRAMADVIQDALTRYLHEDVEGADAIRACEKFCSHGSALERNDIDEILQVDLVI